MHGHLNVNRHFHTKHKNAYKAAYYKDPSRRTASDSQGSHHRLTSLNIWVTQTNIGSHWYFEAIYCVHLRLSATKSW